MKKQRENSIQSDILELLRGDKKKGIKGIGGWWLNFHGGDPFMPRGIPDIIGCYWGMFVALEVKRPGEEPRKLQEKIMRVMEKAGAITATVYNTDDVIKALIRVLSARQHPCFEAHLAELQLMERMKDDATKNKHGGMV